jgi:thiol-disulfide isomerase/thioredoxin
MKLNVLLGIFVLSSVFTLSCANLNAQKKTPQKNTSGYTIKGQVRGIADCPVYLANYYGNKLYYNDTTACDKNGRFQFPGKPFDEQGKYALVIPGPKYFDFIIGSEDIDFDTDTLDLIGHLKFNKSEENKAFYDYVRFINSKRVERQPHDMLLADTLLTDEQKEPSIKKVKELNDQVINYQKKLVADHGNLLVGKFVKMSMELEIPSAPEGVDEAMWKYRWYINNYWTMSDLSDNRMVRDQAFHTMLDRYINKVIPQIPDTIAKKASELIDGVADQPDLFKYMVHFVTYNGLTSKLMCMDKVFVHMVDKYYKTGKAVWMDEEKLKELVDDANNRRRVMCDAKIPNVILPDTSDVNWVSLYDVDAKYTVVAIWESTCGHCKKELPKLLKVYDEWKDRGLEVYSIGNDYERAPWKKFLREKGLTEWINVSDDPAIGNENPDTVRYLLSRGITTIESLNFRQTFNISSTPVLFLLDKDKNIIAKQLNSQQISDLLEHLENKNGEGSIDGMMVKDPDDEDDDEQHEETPKEKSKGAAKSDHKSATEGKKTKPDKSKSKPN